jgi:hypothetical protein
VAALLISRGIHAAASTPQAYTEVEKLTLGLWSVNFFPWIDNLVFMFVPSDHKLAETFAAEIIRLYKIREREREGRRRQASLSPQSGMRSSNLSLERFRTSSKYDSRPAAADIAFCVAAYANGMNEELIQRALEEDYLSRDPSPSKRASYIRRTMTKARDWANR